MDFASGRRQPLRILVSSDGALDSQAWKTMLSRDSAGSAMLDHVLSRSASMEVAGLVGVKGGYGRAVLVECLPLAVKTTVIRRLTSSSGGRIRDAALTVIAIRSVCLYEYLIGSTAEPAARRAEPV